MGDVTEGQVLVSVVTDDDDYLLETTSLSQGDEAVFSAGKKNYSIQLNELRNILIGGDFATFTVTDVDEGR